MTAAQTTLGAPVGQPPTIGVLGGAWRATVTPWGAVQQWDGLGTLDWFIAADDRWYVPADEPTVRQSLVEGAPVVETRVRIPNGDAVHRVYAVADHGGMTIVEVENDSSMPIAIAFAGAALLSQRPPADMPLQGIDLPAGTVAFPVGHRATLTVAIAHDPTTAGARSGQLPPVLSSATQVARGWLAAAERASRLLVPDTTIASCVVRDRCQLMLDGPTDVAKDPVAFLLGVADLVRMGSIAEPWMPEVVDAVAALHAHRDDPLVAAAFDAAERVCIAADERRAVKDLGKVRARVLAGGTSPTAAAGFQGFPHDGGVRSIAQLERTIASGPDLFPGGVPAEWLGQNFEVYGVPTGAASEVSFALRWHGERPAVLWECTGQAVTLTSSGAAPGWSTTERTGETLWPVPAGAVPVEIPVEMPVEMPDEMPDEVPDTNGSAGPPAEGISFN
jgi:hypothetical protein